MTDPSPPASPMAVNESWRDWLLTAEPHSRHQARLGRAYVTWRRFSENWLAVLGLLTGLPAGSIMALPARILPVPERMRGMGYFYTIFYAVIVLSPVAAGILSARSGSARVAFLSSAGLMAVGLVCFALLKIFERRSTARS